MAQGNIDGYNEQAENNVRKEYDSSRKTKTDYSNC